MVHQPNKLAMLFKQGGSCHSRSGALGLGQSQVKGASRSRRSHAGAVSIGRLWEQGTLRTSQNISASSGSKMSNPVKQHMATAKNIRLGSHTQTHTRSIPRSMGYGSKGGCVIQALGSPPPLLQPPLLPLHLPPAASFTVAATATHYYQQYYHHHRFSGRH